ncbi:hypothetical protein B296_00012238 [Ensete ventricosum]|uniref:SUI1 domain-containing protein n=1 Tax=Ensete ventricosum TaxID=4639 RepID=A0A427AW70_ENSVE|nr:hypothetical protein B296_00012238 [Ensete ventricosum]
MKIPPSYQPHTRRTLPLAFKEASSSGGWGAEGRARLTNLLDPPSDTHEQHVTNERINLIFDSIGRHAVTIGPHNNLRSPHDSRAEATRNRAHEQPSTVPATLNRLAKNARSMMPLRHDQSTTYMYKWGTPGAAQGSLSLSLSTDIKREKAPTSEDPSIAHAILVPWRYTGIVHFALCFVKLLMPRRRWRRNQYDPRQRGGSSLLSSLYCRLRRHFRYIITGSGFNCSAFACDLRESRIPVRCCKDYVHIRIQQRNGRKSLTTVQGLKKEFSYNKILKDLKKEFCCNGTVVQDPELGQVISFA